MENKEISILIVDNNDSEIHSVISGMTREIPYWHYTITRASSYEEGLETAEADGFDIYIVQDDLGEHTGLDFLKHRRKHKCTAPVLIVTHDGSYEEDVEAMKAGAADYLYLKRLSAHFLERAVRYALDRIQVLTELEKGLSHFQGICHGVSFGILLFSQSGRIKWANPAVSRMNGYSQEEICSMRIHDLYTEAIGEKLIQRFKKLKPEEKSPRYQQMDECIQKQDHDETCCRFTISLFEKTDADEPFAITLVEDITENVELRRELQASEGHVRKLARQLMEAQETERKYIANDLHDGVGGTLTALLFRLETRRKRNPGNDDAYATDIGLIQQAIQELRRLSNNLRPPILDKQGLIQTIQWFCNEYRSVYAHIQLQEEIAVQEDEIPERVKILLFRILQEAFNNAAKHSNGDRIDIRLQKEAATLLLTVKDNGDGFDLSKLADKRDAQGGLGLISMKERVEFMGGSFNIHSILGDGTQLYAEFPL